MVLNTKNADEGLRVRTAILDATEEIMREEGYAAVSSRKVESRAGLRSQLVHYYFGSMDDLFRAVYQRVEDRYFEGMVQALASDQPLRALWEFSTDTTRTSLILEFNALANHRKTIRARIADSAKRTRSIQVAALARVNERLGIDVKDCPPIVLSLLLAGVTRAMVTEATLGFCDGHDEMVVWIERYLRRIESAPKWGRSAPAKKKASVSGPKIGRRRSLQGQREKTR